MNDSLLNAHIIILSPEVDLAFDSVCDACSVFVRNAFSLQITENLELMGYKYTIVKNSRFERQVARRHITYTMIVRDNIRKKNWRRYLTLYEYEVMAMVEGWCYFGIVRLRHDVQSRIHELQTKRNDQHFEFAS